MTKQKKVQGRRWDDASVVLTIEHDMTLALGYTTLCLKAALDSSSHVEMVEALKTAKQEAEAQARRLTDLIAELGEG